MTEGGRTTKLVLLSYHALFVLRYLKHSISVKRNVSFAR